MFLSHQRPKHGSNSYDFFFGLGFSLNFQIQSQQNSIALVMLMLHFQQAFLRVAAFSEDADFGPAKDFVFMAVDFNRLQQSQLV